MRLDDSEALRRASECDHGVLSTLHSIRGVDAVPVCFAIDGDVVGIPIDRVKPKASESLERVRNLARDPRASLLCEHWDAADWSRLWWVRLALIQLEVKPDAVARLDTELRRRYPQYATATFDGILTLRIVAVTGWSAS